MLKNKGYTNNNSCLIQPNKDDKHECSICYDSSDKSEYVKLKCGHIYHKKCIEEAIKIFFNSPEKMFKESRKLLKNLRLIDNFTQKKTYQFYDFLR